jgi:hypothetical protein
MGRSDKQVITAGTKYINELRNPSRSVRRDVEGAYIASFSEYQENEYLLKAGVQLKLIDSYRIEEVRANGEPVEAVTMLLWELYNPLRTAIPFLDPIDTIKIKERITFKPVAHPPISDIIATDYYGRNIYFLAAIALGQSYSTGLTDDMYDIPSDVIRYANVDKYDRDVAYYVKTQPDDRHHKDVYGNTPLLYKLLHNDMFVNVNPGVGGCNIMCTKYLYDLDILTITNNEGMMPITMFDSLEMLFVDGVYSILRMSDSLGRTALHRLVFIFRGFMLYQNDDGEVEFNKTPKYEPEDITKLMIHFDHNKRDIFGKTAKDYYMDSRSIHTWQLDVLFYPKFMGVVKWDRWNKFKFLTDIEL